MEESKEFSARRMRLIRDKCFQFLQNLHDEKSALLQLETGIEQ